MGLCETGANQLSHNNIDSWKTAISRVMSNINTDNVMHAWQRFLSSNEAVIAAEGGYIE